MTPVDRPTSRVDDVQPDAVVVLDRVTRTFDGGVHGRAVRGVSLTIRRGEYVSFTGRSGCGKSTLLHILGLLDRPTSGVYALNGFETAGLNDRDRASLRGREIGFVFQAFHLLAHRSAVENVELALLYRDAAPSERRRRAIAALRSVGLGHRLGAMPNTLSGGERQRVAIARAIVGEPSILIADEPTGNLDSRTAKQTLKIFRALNRTGLTLIIATHDADLARRADRQMAMVDGTLAEVAR